MASLGSFSRAAEALFLTQPAVSEQVRRLEIENDILLFNRSRKGAQLTSAGRRLFLLTKRNFEIEGEINECLSEWKTRLTGQLRLVADSVQHVTDILSRFRDSHPDVKITIRSGNTETVVTELWEYNAEIGVIGSLPKVSGLQSLEIGSTSIIAFARHDLVLAEKTEMSMEEIASYPLVLREPG